MNTTVKKAALRSATCFAAFAICTTGAYAQDAADDANTGEAIIVTGSRIVNPNLTSASPVTVVNAADIAATGTTRVEDLVNSLPQVFAGQGGNVSNGSSGTATLNLRNLGEERTMVLVNGRRLMPGDPNSSAADINAIPAALIKRVDVLTGGASATYGSDAIAGVVNFVMDTDFEGFRLDSQYSFYQHNNSAGSAITGPLDAAGYDYPSGSSANGGTVDTTLSFGTSFDDGRGHITAYVGYRKINAVLQGSRDYASCALSGSSISGFGCGGSSTSPTGRFLLTDDFSSYQPNPDGSATFVPGYGIYNYNPLNYYQRPDERYTAGFFANYEINSAIKPYAEFMFMDDRTVAQIAPSGDFGNTSTLNCDNPLLSAQQLSIICRPSNIIATRVDPTTGASYDVAGVYILRRNVEGGPRQDDLQHTSYRAVLGSQGDLSPEWSYDAYYQYGRTNFAETYLNDLSATRVARALDVVTDPSTGSAVCRSVLDGSDPNCVPWNIFQLGQVDPAATAYLSTPGFQRGQTSEQVLSATVTGDLTNYGIVSPWAQDGVQMLFGFEYRKESLVLNTDQAFQTGDLTGQGAATLPVSGSFHVTEFFTEASLPIIQDSFVKEFSINAGYRYSKYKNADNSFSTDTYKVEATLAPTADIAFRAGYNRAVRAPNVQNLFAPNRIALDGNTDGCAGSDPEYTAAQCAYMGVTAAQYGNIPANPADQYNGYIGGNGDLSPEVADTYTAGVVLTPTFLPGFTASVDYFDIKLKGAIQRIGADTILNACAETGDSFICSLIHRDASGSLWLSSNGYVTDTTQNIGSLRTKGIDVAAAFVHELSPSLGKLNLSFQGTYLDKLTIDSGIGTPDECAGQFGPVCGTPSPKWRHQARLGWEMPSGIGASLRWRYFGSADNGDSEHFSPQSYFDLNLSARIEDHYTLRFGVNNVFDKAPPVTGGSNLASVYGNGNTYPNVYDALGRYIFTSVSMDF
ncbi:TonB-dependent receptor domain-containing protein [Novosphingobium naphthalenivorans]|uniref:TonB-dependent receptor domain-containing protein n=1 Tax=Novosphingobium naphthalenivorans TaxID=273168 RepID=UPI0008298E5E|nr:TonB-dependent receptor [Novosphingobium naphthalenivorans]